MKKFAYVLIISAIGFAACSGHKKVIKTQTDVSTQVSDDTKADGSSFEKAIVIKANNERTGINAEYAWIRANYPGYRTRSQALNYHGKKSYDVLHIENASGDKKDVYFDITNFLGKF